MKRLLCSALVLALVGSSPLWAQDKEKEDEAVAKALKNLADLGPGVHKIKFDKKGRIKTCVVVGSSRISTVLGKSKGLQVAQKRAALSARGEFVKWLKADVEIHESSEDETTLFIEGSEENDEGTKRESGKTLEKDTATINSVAKGLVRGFQLLHREVNGEDKQLTLVYGWSIEAAAATRKIADRENSDGKAKGKGGSKGKKGKSSKKTIKNKSTTSDDAKKFID